MAIWCLNGSVRNRYISKPTPPPDLKYRYKIQICQRVNRHDRRIRPDGFVGKCGAAELWVAGDYFEAARGSMTTAEASGNCGRVSCESCFLAA